LTDLKDYGADVVFYFRKLIGLGPLALNLSKSGAGLSLGVRGFHAGISSSRRPYVSASIPSTGLYLRQYADSHAPAHAIAGGGPVSVPHPRPPRTGTAHHQSPLRAGLFVRLASLPRASSTGADLVGRADIVGQVNFFFWFALTSWPMVSRCSAFVFRN
jgi:hypothetical protein